MKLIKLILLALALSACLRSGSRFSASSKLQNNDPWSYTVHCDAERKSKNQTHSLDFPVWQTAFKLEPQCIYQDISTSTERKAYSINLMIVLDVSESMQSTINELKELLEQVSEHLLREGWAVKFGLVLFRDYVNDYHIEPPKPSNIKNILRILSNIKAEYGGSPNESGLRAISIAQRTIAENLPTKSTNQQINVVLYLSDAQYAYYSTKDHTNTSLSPLLEDAKSWLQNDFDNFAIYYWTPKDSQKQQFKDFLAQSKLTGGELDSLDSKTISKKIVSPINFVSSGTFITCTLETASLESTGSGLSSRDTKTGTQIEQELLDKGYIMFTNSPDPTQDTYKLQIQRCCQPSQQKNATCTYTQNYETILSSEAESPEKQ